jgi:hypothetical protein
MKLDVRFLEDVGGLNAWRYAQNNPSFYEGDTVTIYLQVVDGGSDNGDQRPRRYMPAAGAVLTVDLDSVDSAKRVMRTLTQPFAQDPSIWRMDIASTDPFRGTVDLSFRLTEGAAIHSARVKAGLKISSTQRV